MFQILVSFHMQNVESSSFWLENVEAKVVGEFSIYFRNGSMNSKLVGNQTCIQP